MATTTRPPFNPAAFRREVAARGLTLRELSTASGVHVISLSRYNTGHTRPRPRTLTKLAVALARVPRLPVDLIAEPAGATP